MGDISQKNVPGNSGLPPAPGQGMKFFSNPVVQVLIIVILGFLAYSNTFHGPFQWDESDFLVKNPIVRDLGFFSEPSKAEGLPVYDGLKSRYIGYLTFALNYKLHGFEVFGYHVVNLAIHLINAMLVYFLVLLTFRTPWFNPETSNVKSEKLVVSSEKAGNSRFTIHDSRVVDYSHFFALAVALLFVSHPVQTEAVTYVFQRLASLVSLFYLLSLVFYIKGRLASSQAHRLTSRHAGKLASYSVSLLSTVLAMKTKENAFTLPIVITLYEFLFFSGPVKTRMLRLLPFLLTMLIIPVTLAGISRPAGEIIGQVSNPEEMGLEGLPWNYYFITQFRVIITYIRLLFMPLNQSIYHDYPIYRSFFEPPVLFSFLFLTALFGLALYLLYKSRQGARGKGHEKLYRSRQEAMGYEQEVAGENSEGSPIAYRLSPIACYRLIGFGLLWFFITLSVESSIIPIPMVMDEYRVYLPSVGFLLAVTAAFFLMVNRASEHRAGRKELSKVKGAKNTMRLALGALLVAVLALASVTYARNELWKNRISLWEDVVRKSPAFPLGYVNLGLAYYEKGLYDKAIAMDKRAIALLPVYLDTYINLGVAYSAAGKADLAIETYKRAMAMYPDNSILYYNLAHACAEDGRNEMAVENFLAAIRLDPYSSKAYHSLGTVYSRLGRFDDAIAAYSKFVLLSPNDPEAYRNRGIAYESKGDLSNARGDFQRACSLGSEESCNYLQDAESH